MIAYNSFKYLYPPRAEVKISPSCISMYDNNQFIGQPKLNGSCAVFFSHEGMIPVFYNRHGQGLTNFKPEKFTEAMHRGNGYMVLAGEYLNKNKGGEDKNPFNHKFVIWDILVYESQYLLGMELEERIALLDSLYPPTDAIVNDEGRIESYKALSCTVIPDVYRVRSFEYGFAPIYHALTQTDVYEGLVLKKKGSKLGIGMNEKNNTDWQIKVRKETKNYQF